ncbi:MAG TPA: stage II sporulation protein R [Clostridia bacterium]|nr:stage II sporulation protein R [Clostridia bacterium]
MIKVKSFINKAGNLKGKKGYLKIAAALLITVMISGILQLNSYSESVNKGLAENLIRLHVIANSDSPEDQSLKRDVRDAILAYVQNELKASDNIEKSRSIIKERLTEITNTAKKVIADKGRNYGVRTILGEYPFPTKVYGDIVLPAGEYQALRVVIGEGRGANWWCVLFPPLCFVDVTHGTVPDSVKEDLKKVLTDEEYDVVTSSDNEGEIPIKIKFKIVEMFQDSKVKLAGAIDKLFKTQG